MGRYGCPMAVRRIVPNLHVADVARSCALYTELLGLDPVMDHGWIASLAEPSGEGAGPSAVQLSVMSEDATAPVVPSASIEVDDVDAVHALVRELGLEVVHPLTDEPWGVRRFFFRDPDGNVLNVLGHR